MSCNATILGTPPPYALRHCLLTLSRVLCAARALEDWHHLLGKSRELFCACLGRRSSVQLLPEPHVRTIGLDVLQLSFDQFET